MKRKGYLPRLIDAEIDRYLEIFGAVCVEGPKWCGKTWSAAVLQESLVGKLKYDAPETEEATEADEKN